MLKQILSLQKRNQPRLQRKVLVQCHWYGWSLLWTSIVFMYGRDEGIRRVCSKEKNLAALYGVGLTYSMIVSWLFLFLWLKVNRLVVWVGSTYIAFPALLSLLWQVQTRYILRTLLPRYRFKQVRSAVYFFVNFFAYGLFPLTYMYLLGITADN